MNHPLKHFPNRSGFSLVELLTVLAIIAILSSAGLISMQGNSTSVSLGGGEAQAASLLQSARNLAILKNTNTRLLVGADPTNAGTYLKTMAIVYASVNSSGTTQWTSATKQENLPQSIYFNPTRSGDVSTPIPTMSLTIPATTATPGTGPPWYYYEFASSGATANNSTEGFIVVAGHLISQQVVSPNANMARGFVIHRLGTFIYYESPAQIPP